MRDTFITRRVKLTHHGKMDFSNAHVWGSFTDGDEQTADKWRESEKPLRMLQIIDFELGEKCNLGHVHDKCPNRSPERFSLLDTTKQMDDATIIEAAVAAYSRLGFTGMIGFHYYNEPLLESERLFKIAGEIKARAPGAKFLLWTNGMLIPESPEQYRVFSEIVISGYNAESKRGADRLEAIGVKSRYVPDAQLDNRMQLLTPANKSAPCMRPFLEMIFDAYGNTHLCCYDWRGEGTNGNLLTTSIDVLAAKWRASLPKIAGDKLAEDAPKVCAECAQRWDNFQVHDPEIVQRAQTWRAQNRTLQAAGV